ncbi:DNA-directed RNA polymerase I subunit RPA49, partial [Lecanoromycetidae sp. Uapishka_2]
MSERKRKRHEERQDDRPNKQAAIESLSQTIKVSVIEDGEQWVPILGLSLHPNISFQPYTKASTATSRPSAPGPELLLHSSAHPKLDYTACEETSNGSENHLKDYIGVYDPSSGQLQLVQARKLVVRSTLRSERDSGSKKNKDDIQDAFTARSNLGLAFGTKKSQKAIRALTTNAIQASPSKPNNNDIPAHSLAHDPLASAVVSSMPSASSMPTRDEMQAEVDMHKPRPKANLDAETPGDVYPTEELVGGLNVLRTTSVKEWIDKVKAGEDIQTKSLFVSRRLRAEVQSGDVKRIKTLKYLLLLVEWFRGLKPINKGGLRVPKMEDMAELVSVWGNEIVAGVGRRFAEEAQLNKWHTDNLITHILALAITFDRCTSDTHDIQNDLRLETKGVGKYYAELGCVIAPPTEIERTRLNISKAEAGNHRIARLKLPLVFRKMRVPVGRKKR